MYLEFDDTYRFGAFRAEISCSNSLRTIRCVLQCIQSRNVKSISVKYIIMFPVIADHFYVIQST